jgi:hypothetical protein
MSSRLLKLIGDPRRNGTIDYRASDDLESLFYIFFEATIIYGGPQGQKEGRAVFPTQYNQWRGVYEQMDANGLGISGTVKKDFLTDKSEDTVMYTVAKYFAACGPILQDWRAAIGMAIQGDRDISHKDIHKIIEKHLKEIESSQPRTHILPGIASSSATPSTIPMPPTAPTRHSTRKSSRPHTRSNDSKRTLRSNR